MTDEVRQHDYRLGHKTNVIVEYHCPKCETRMFLSADGAESVVGNCKCDDDSLRVQFGHRLRGLFRELGNLSASCTELNITIHDPNTGERPAPLFAPPKEKATG